MAKEKRPEIVESFETNGWKFQGVKHHILSQDQEHIFNEALSLPHLPDMVFAKNRIRISKGDFGFELNPLDALKHVNDHQDLIHVALSKEWMEARKESPHINKIVHPYDWTYTPTDYRGSVFGDIKVSDTEQKIDYEKLKVREKILFFDEVILYEDELDDNGCAVLTTKVRVMPSGFFCLLRFYLRVDNTLIRVYDTRFHHEFGQKYILREYSEREDKTTDLQVPSSVWRDQNEISSHLSLRREVVEKLELPEV